jgi:hypothetical protein
MPHHTAPAASATGTPVPIEGAGAGKRGVGKALATIVAPMQNPAANVSNFIIVPTSSSNLTQLQSVDDGCNQS